MAKISARGATEIARVKAHSEAADVDYLFVLTSDGRVLSRTADTNYTLAHKVKHESNLNMTFLRRFVLARGLTIVE